MVTFETKCWENDWEFILGGNYLEELICRCNYDFKERVLFINNVSNLSKVKRCADKKIKNKVIDSYYVVEEFAEKALNYFDIEKDSFKGGYNYSIAELVGIYLCKTDYLLHFSSDSFLHKNKSKWISKAISIFEERSDIVVANPTWNDCFVGAKAESFDDIGDFYVGYGFSDQCYLIRMDTFKKSIYNESHPASARYPHYGGELFEKRVDSFMRNHEKQRITNNEVSYIHQNFPKSRKERLLLKYKIQLLPIGLSMP